MRHDITPARLRDLADEGPLHTRSWSEIAAALRAAADQIAARDALLRRALDSLAALECTAQLLDDWGAPRKEPIPDCETILIGRSNHGRFDVSASTDLGACRRARALAAEMAAFLKGGDNAPDV